jgi:hypothetical protein
MPFIIKDNEARYYYNYRVIEGEVEMVMFDIAAMGGKLQIELPETIQHDQHDQPAKTIYTLVKTFGLKVPLETAWGRVFRLKRSIRVEAEKLNITPHNGPVSLDWTAVYPGTPTAPNGVVPHIGGLGRGWLDIIIMAALSGIAYLDIEQVFAGTNSKRIQWEREEPHLAILVRYWAIKT